MLLIKDDFRNGVFERDNYRCVICNASAQDAHHIMERRLFLDGGYYLSNGSSLCGSCHIKAEQTLLSTKEIREACGIKEIKLPPHLYSDNEYDKWGNIINPNGTRTMGELYHDKSVQKIIPDEIKKLFSPYVKYPRTYHVPWTESTTSDDRIHESMDYFIDKKVVVSEKMDGENSSIYNNGYFHARSVDGNGHPSQGWLKNYMQQWCYELPENWRVCGENLYAVHSIEYYKLDSYFNVFSVWNEKNECLSWSETIEWCELLGLNHVPVLYQGVYDEEAIKNIQLDKDWQEGYVLRIENGFSYGEFRKCVAKFVRKNHVQKTANNWRCNWSGRINGIRK